MSKPPTGRRVNIYLPADVLEVWDRIPRFERSAEVAAALRERWARTGRFRHTSAHTPPDAPAPAEPESAAGRGKAPPSDTEC